MEALEELMTDCHLTTVSNGEQLITHLKTTSCFPDFIFVDINMPRLNGIECLRHIRTSYPESSARIIMLSTAASSQVIEQSYLLGADVYIQKPGKFNELKGYIHYCLHNLDRKIARQDFVLNDLLKSY